MASQLSTDKKVQIIKHAKVIIDYLTAIENSVLDDIKNGSDNYSDHFKLVRKNTHRKLTEDAFDEDFSPLLDHLERDDLYEEKPKAMGKLKKLLAEKLDSKQAEEIINSVCVKPDGDLTIAPLNDKRKEVEPDVKKDFAGLEDL